MIDYLTRMEEEKKSLDRKIDSLNTFINKEDSRFHKLTIHDQDLLVAQLNAMYTYSMILKIRLDEGHMK